MSDDTQLATVKDKQKVMTLVSGSRGIQLRSFEDAWLFAQSVWKSGLAPSTFENPQQILIALQTGAEVGLPPMQALQSIAVINRRPTIWGDAVPGLVRSGGNCEYIKEWIDGEGDSRTAHCESKRKDETEPCHRTFSVADAKKAGLWQTEAIVTRHKRGGGGTYEKENDSPWWKYPDRMLAMRARSWCLRDTYADALRGLQIREEVEDYSHAVTGEVIDATPQKVGLLDDLEPEADDEPVRSESYTRIKAAIDATDDRDAEAVGEHYQDIAVADDDGSLLDGEADDLRSMMTGWRAHT